MMRLFAMLAIGAGSALFVMPMLALAQSSSSANDSPAEATRKFRAYLDEDWKRWMEEYPEMATSAGYPWQNRRWSDDSAKGTEARIKHLHGSMTLLKTVSREALPVEEQLNYDLYRNFAGNSGRGFAVWRRPDAVS